MRRSSERANKLDRARFDHPIGDAGDAIDWDSLVERFLGMSRRAAGLKTAILAPGQTAPL